MKLRWLCLAFIIGWFIGTVRPSGNDYLAGLDFFFSCFRLFSIA